MSIKDILDEIAAEGGSNAKMDILESYKDNEILKRVIYLAKSPRVKVYIRQIPKHEFTFSFDHISLSDAMKQLDKLSSREFTGGQASEWLQSILNSLSIDDAYVIVRIIDKDLKIGMGTSNINKIFPKLIEKTPYMGAKSFNEK